MTHRIGDRFFVIEPEGGTCTRCGRDEDTRDVLGDGSRVCFGCATEQERRGHCARIFGPPKERPQ